MTALMTISDETIVLFRLIAPYNLYKCDCIGMSTKHSIEAESSVEFMIFEECP